eukprot:13799836-Ditylum_brightwellii.AAC.1
MVDDTNFSCQSNQFDLISAIDSMINESPFVWKWCWMKGHQDEKKREHQADATNPPPTQYTLATEMWRLYTG